MRQNAGRNTEGVANIFYEGPEGQSGRRIFYFIVSHIGLADYDLLGYRILDLLSDASTPFDIVLDMTGFAPSTELPITWLVKMVQLCPPGLLDLVNVRAAGPQCCR